MYVMVESMMTYKYLTPGRLLIVMEKILVDDLNANRFTAPYYLKLAIRRRNEFRSLVESSGLTTTVQEKMIVKFNENLDHMSIHIQLNHNMN